MRLGAKNEKRRGLDPKRRSFRQTFFLTLAIWFSTRACMKNLLLVLIAWVLWNESTYFVPPDPPSSFWNLISATPDYNDCQKNLDAKVQDLARGTDESAGPNVRNVTRKKDGNMIFITTYLKDGRTTSQIHRLICLPDTIDPRGPKPKN